MKKFLSFFLLMLAVITVKAQTPPEAFNYSAVARDASGSPIANSTIGIQISIKIGSSLGATVYQENHFVNTDDFGLFNLIVGGGSVLNGSISGIDWSADDYYLQVGMDANGGTNFLTMGSTQLLSVPYALYAKSAGSTAGIFITSVSNNGDTLFLSNGQTFINSNSGGSGGGGGSGSGTFTHYIGEEFGGGVIFHLWLDANGVEHGLIVDKTYLSTAQVWSNVDDTQINTSPNPTFLFDGLSNSSDIVGQAGHTSSAAALCLNSANGGYNDWYLPALDELSQLWDNRYDVNKTLSTIGGASQLGMGVGLWSSTEGDYEEAGIFNLDYDNNFSFSNKDRLNAVRAIRKF